MPYGTITILGKGSKNPSWNLSVEGGMVLVFLIDSWELGSVQPTIRPARAVGATEGHWGPRIYPLQQPVPGGVSLQHPSHPIGNPISHSKLSTVIVDNPKFVFRNIHLQQKKPDLMVLNMKSEKRTLVSWMLFMWSWVCWKQSLSWMSSFSWILFRCLLLNWRNVITTRTKTDFLLRILYSA